MTVKELITELSKLPQELPVYVPHCQATRSHEDPSEVYDVEVQDGIVYLD